MTQTNDNLLQLRAPPAALATLHARRLYGTTPPQHPLCPKCGYNLTGLPSSPATPCPECGRPVAIPEKRDISLHVSDT